MLEKRALALAKQMMQQNQQQSQQEEALVVAKFAGSSKDVMMTAA